MRNPKDQHLVEQQTKNTKKMFNILHISNSIQLITFWRDDCAKPLFVLRQIESLLLGIDERQNSLGINTQVIEKISN